MVAYIIAGVVITLIAIFTFKNQAETDSRNEAIYNLHKTYLNDGILLLNEESLPMVKGYLHIQSLKINTVYFDVKYEPTVYTINDDKTISRGGCTKVVSHTPRISNSEDSGFYEIVLGDRFDPIKQATVSGIKLSSSLLEKAKKDSTIANYIKKDTIIVRDKVKFTAEEESERIAYLKKRNNYETTTTPIVIYKGYPQIDKAQAILSWVLKQTI